MAEKVTEKRQPNGVSHTKKIYFKDKLIYASNLKEYYVIQGIKKVEIDVKILYSFGTMCRRGHNVKQP